MCGSLVVRKLSLEQLSLELSTKHQVQGSGWSGFWLGWAGLVIASHAPKYAIVGL